MPMPRLKIVNRKPSQVKAADWINLEKKIDAENGDWHFGEILNLEDLTTIKYKETSSDIIILAQISSETECPCGVLPPMLKKNGWTSPCTVLDSPVRYKRTSIYFRVQRYHCGNCHNVIQQKATVIHKKHRLTNRLVNYIEKTSLNISKNFSEIGTETGVHEKVIRNIFTNHVKELEENRQIITPTWVAIDEVCLATRKSARCVITAPASRIVVDFLEKNDRKTLSSWLLQLPERSKVKVVSIDMYAPYRLTISTILPNAKIVVDRYHVQNLLNNALKEVLGVIRASLTAREQEDHPVSEHLLLKSRFHLIHKNSHKKIRFSEKEKIAKLFDKFSDLARAYTLKEDFSDILQLSNRQTAEKRADIWLEQVNSFHVDFIAKYKKQCGNLRKYPFRNVLRTIKFWLPCILNYINFKYSFDIKVTNAFAEFANKQIKQAYNKANGCSFDVLRAKVVHGNFLKDSLPPHPIKSKKKHSVRRGQLDNEQKTFNDQSNLVLLRKTRENRDKTKNLLPKPQEFDGWINRFNYFDRANFLDEEKNNLVVNQGVNTTLLVKSLESKRCKKNKTVKSKKHNPDQIKLF